jgi:hypothetical protein
MKPYSILFFGLILVLAYPASIVLGRKNSYALPANLPPGWNITLPAKAISLVDQPASLVFMEIEAGQTTSRIWKMRLDEPENLQELAVIQHAHGYYPATELCPAQNMVFTVIIPPGSSEVTARIDGGELWQLDQNQKTIQFLASKVGSPPFLSPDCEAIIFSRLIPIPQPTNPHIPYRTEFILVEPSQNNQKIIYSDEKSYGVNPIGWDEEGELFYFFVVTLQGEYSIKALKSNTGVVVNTWNLTNFQSVRSIDLSPAANKIMLEGSRDGVNGLFVIDLSTNGQPGITSQTVIPLSNNPSQSAFRAVWSEDGLQIWAAPLLDSLMEAKSSLWSLQSHASSPIIAPDSQFPGKWIPEALSADSRWRVWREYANAYPALMIEQPETGKKVNIPRGDDRNHLVWVGWLGK